MAAPGSNKEVAMKKLLLFAALALCVARPSFAQYATEKDASFGTGEGQSSGAVHITLNGSWDAEALGLAQDPSDGKWKGSGSIHYHANGINVDEDHAAFVVTMVPSPSVGSGSLCEAVSQFPSVVEIFNGSGQRLLFASGLRYDAGSDPANGICPWGRTTANVGLVPDSLVRLKMKYLH